MEERPRRLKKISAFAAYNGLRVGPPIKSAHPMIADQGKMKEKRKRNRHSDTALTKDISSHYEIIMLDDSVANNDRVQTTNVSAQNGKPVKSKKKKRKAHGGAADQIQKRKRGNQDHINAVENGSIDQDQPNPSPVAEINPEAKSDIWKILNKLKYQDSTSDARQTFAWLISPTQTGWFFEQYWEKKPFRIQRNDPKYYDGLFSTEKLDWILKENDIQYSVNLDITKYENGERKTLNPSGRAYAATVWDFYKDGCSIRLLNPQTYSQAVWKLNSTLQEFFGTFVGANVYLTPASTQGFAPHYDDIEAFVVQLEGVKKWRVYEPRSVEETLPRFSSPNFKPHEIGKPIMEVELRPGDLLYFPRGFIHEAVASGDEHSLHMTISTTQRNSWGDYMQILLEQTIQVAMTENIEYRRSLPLNYMDFMGIVHEDKKKKERKDFVDKVKQLFNNLMDHASIDGAADQMAKTYMHDSLPPCLTNDEIERSIHGINNKSPVVLKKNSKVRLIRKHCLRLVMENEAHASIYYNTENGRIYREKDPQCFTIEPDLAPGVDYLVEMYPKFIQIKELPLEADKDKIRICQMLFDKALLMVEKE